MWIHKTLSVGCKNMHNVNNDEIAEIAINKGLVSNAQRQYTLHGVIIWTLKFSNKQLSLDNIQVRLHSK